MKTAALGDVYRLASRPEPPAIIGLVDGYFERRPPVRHAEILWTLSRGIRVLGAASIGALRAAELAAHGMEGVGGIFEGYDSGRLLGEPLEADDEVAVLHGPAELGYPPLTVALVDLRASFAAAAAAGIVSEDERRNAVESARRLSFRERSYAAAMAALPTGRQAALAAWLSRSAVSLKQRDARLLIERVQQLRTASGRVSAARPFQVTDSRLDFAEWAGSGDPMGSSDAELLVALALEPALREQVLRHALLRLLADREAARRARDGDSIGVLLDLYGPSLARRLGRAVNELGLRGSVQQAIGRRRRGREALASGALSLDRSAGALLRWHCERIGAPLPPDLEAYAQSLGLSRGEQLIRALAEDFVTLERRDPDSTSR